MSLPLEDASVDVVISNGVLNLTPDKAVAYGEVFRVLKPGGRFLYADIAVAGDEPRLHAHVVVGKADGTAHGGHLIDAIVRPTLEVMLTEAPAHLRRRFDPKTGLALLAV